MSWINRSTQALFQTSASFECCVLSILLFIVCLAEWVKNGIKDQGFIANPKKFPSDDLPGKVVMGQSVLRRGNASAWEASLKA